MFVERLEKEIKAIYYHNDFNHLIVMTTEDNSDYKTATMCWISNEA